MNKETLTQIMKKAATDIDYRRRLARMPRAVLMQEGFEVPADKKVVVLESSDDLIYVVLPPSAAPPTPSAKTFSWQLAGNTLHLQGQLDNLAVEKIRPQLPDWHSDLIVDMEKLAYISSAGLGLLLMLQQKLQRNGFTIRLVHLQAPVRNVFVLSGFDTIFNI